MCRNNLKSSHFLSRYKLQNTGECSGTVRSPVACCEEDVQIDLVILQHGGVGGGGGGGGGRRGPNGDSECAAKPQ